MKNILFSCFLIFASISMGYSQQIEKEKGFGGYKYTQNGKRLNLKQISQAVSSNSESSALMKQAKVNNAVAAALGFVGGGIVGYSFGAASGSPTGGVNWNLVLAGTGLIAVGVPFSYQVGKKTSQAVDLYNSSLNANTFHRPKVEFRFGIGASAVGMSLRF